MHSIENYSLGCTCELCRMVRGRAERLGKTIEETIPVVRRIRKIQDAFGFLGTFVAAFVVVLGFFGEVAIGMSSETSPESSEVIQWEESLKAHQMYEFVRRTRDTCTAIQIAYASACTRHAALTGARRPRQGPLNVFELWSRNFGLCTTMKDAFDAGCSKPKMKQ